MEITYSGEVESVLAQELSKVVTVGWYMSKGDERYKFLTDSIRVPGDADDDHIAGLLARRKAEVAKSAPKWPDVAINQNLVGREI